MKIMACPMYYLRVTTTGTGPDAAGRLAVMQREPVKQKQDSQRQCATAFRSAFFCLGLLLGAALLASLPAAHAASSSVRVTARILPWLDVSATPRVSSYRVDAAAIERGFVDLPGALSIRMATNLNSEIDLSLSSFGPERILVDNGSFPGAELIRMGQLTSTVPVLRNFDLRIMLPQDIKEGEYPLNLNVSALNI